MDAVEEARLITALVAPVNVRSSLWCLCAGLYGNECLLVECVSQCRWRAWDACFEVARKAVPTVTAPTVGASARCMTTQRLTVGAGHMGRRPVT